METQEYRERLELLYDVAQRATSLEEVSHLLEEVLSVTQRVLRTSASSILLANLEKGELYFKAAGGEAANTLLEMRLDLYSGIAGWVASHGTPLVCNDVSRDQRFNEDIDKITGFVTRSIMAAPLLRGKKVVGVLEVLNKEDGSAFNEQDLRALIGLASTEALILLVSMAATAIRNIQADKELRDGYKSTVETLVAAADARDPHARGHSRRVKEYTLLAANRLSFSPEELQLIEIGALLHDIGKLGIRDAILRKSEPGDEEQNILRKHPSRGANIVSDIPFLKKVTDIIRHHHERYDGTGYPDGLSGEDIPIGARLVAVADAFDNMTTGHSSESSLDEDEAMIKLVGGIGSQFCPVAVKAFVSGWRKGEGRVLEEEAEPAIGPGVTKESQEAKPVAEKKVPEETKKEEPVAEKKLPEESPKAEPVAEMKALEELKAAYEKAEVPVPIDTGWEMYKGEVRLLITSPVAFEQVITFKEAIKRIENLQLLLIGGSLDKETTMLISIQEPMPLLRILGEMPIVAKVDKKDGDTVVTLKPKVVGKG